MMLFVMMFVGRYASSFEYIEIEIDGFGSRHYLMTVDNLKTKQNNNRCH